jgi:hypothetical protein
MRPRPNGDGRRRVQEPIEPQLYNLDSDIGETIDVASDHPEIVARLLAHVERARKDLGDGDQPGARQRPAGHVENPEPLLPIVRE